MSKLSRLIVMAIVILAVIAMSVSVNAYTNNDLIGYVNGIHNINNIIFELSNKQKSDIINYLTANPVDDATANSIKSDIDAIEAQIRNTGATHVDQISKDVKANVIAIAKSAIAKAGATLSVDTANGTFTITGKDGKAVTSGSVSADISYVKATGGSSSPATGSTSTQSNSSSSKTGKKTLLYTGSNYALYALPIVAIVAVAVLGRKKENA